MKNKIWTDNKLGTINWLSNRLYEENLRQLEKWGVQERSPFEWMCYLTEEVGELAEAISEYIYRDGGWIDIHKEAIQAATLALKIAEMAQLGRGEDE